MQESYKPRLIKATWAQKPDDLSDRDEQRLTVEMKDAGGGAYYVISTKEWALDVGEDINDLIAQVTGPRL